MLRPRGVTNHVGRISVRERKITSEQAYLELFQSLRDGMRTGIEQLMTCQPDHLIMGLAAADLCAAAEHWLGKPVLSINAVTYWDALRRSGIEDRVYGHGSVLERF